MTYDVGFKLLELHKFAILATWDQFVFLGSTARSVGYGEKAAG